jgi:hypothetical protein
MSKKPNMATLGRFLVKCEFSHSSLFQMKMVTSNIIKKLGAKKTAVKIGCGSFDHR